jgi:hypothetical protein
MLGPIGLLALSRRTLSPVSFAPAELEDAAAPENEKSR